MKTIILSDPDQNIAVGQREFVRIIGIFTKGWKSPKQLNLTSGPHSQVDIVCVFLGSCDESFPLNFLSVQQGIASRVSCSFRSALFDSSSTEGSAILRIERGSDGSDAFFSHHILLLSDAARGKTIPSLEIETSHATAKHAASAAPLDSEGLWYLSTRGCGDQAARILLTKGFLMAEVAALTDESERIRAEHTIDSFLVQKVSV